AGVRAQQRGQVVPAADVLAHADPVDRAHERLPYPQVVERLPLGVEVDAHRRAGRLGDREALRLQLLGHVRVAGGADVDAAAAQRRGDRGDVRDDRAADLVQVRLA